MYDSNFTIYYVIPHITVRKTPKSWATIHLTNTYLNLGFQLHHTSFYSSHLMKKTAISWALINQIYTFLNLESHLHYTSFLSLHLSKKTAKHVLQYILQKTSLNLAVYVIHYHVYRSWNTIYLTNPHLNLGFFLTSQ